MNIPYPTNKNMANIPYENNTNKLESYTEMVIAGGVGDGKWLLKGVWGLEVEVIKIF